MRWRLGEEARLGSRDVEADDAAVAVPDRELGDLEGAIGMAHRRHELPGTDGSALVPHVVDALLDAGLHGLDGVVETQAPA